MWVWKATTRPRSTCAHLLCVPGSTASVAAVSSSNAPASCVSSPRITSGTPLPSRAINPGTIASSRPGVQASRSASESNAAGHATYGASTHPCRLPIMPAANRGTSSVRQSPSSFANALEKPSPATFCTPSGSLRVPQIRPCASTAYARADVVPQSIASSATDVSTPVSGTGLDSFSPLLRGLVVTGPRFHPARSVRRHFLLPERRTRLQIIHHEPARVERIAAVCAGDADEHDRLGRRELADAMDDADVVDVEALLRLADDVLERLLGHARIVLERQRRNGGIVVHVAHRTDERRDRANTPVMSSKPRDLLADVERFALHADHGHPPVTGGNSATSSPSRTRSSS